jgi:sialidase-1
LECSNAGCAASIIAVPKEAHGRRFLLHTTPTGNQYGWSMLRDRTRFTAFVSFDDGKTWPIRKVIFKGASGYSVSVMGPEGNFFVLYEKGKGHYRDTGVSIVKFNLEWLLDGKDINSFPAKNDSLAKGTAPVIP